MTLFKFKSKNDYHLLYIVHFVPNKIILYIVFCFIYILNLVFVISPKISRPLCPLMVTSLPPIIVCPFSVPPSLGRGRHRANCGPGPEVRTRDFSHDSRIIFCPTGSRDGRLRRTTLSANKRYLLFIIVYWILKMPGDKEATIIVNPRKIAALYNIFPYIEFTAITGNKPIF